MQGKHILINSRQINEKYKNPFFLFFSRVRYICFWVASLATAALIAHLDLHRSLASGLQPDLHHPLLSGV
jgi:hypothetical protein